MRQATTAAALYRPLPRISSLGDLPRISSLGELPRISSLGELSHERARRLHSPQCAYAYANMVPMRMCTLCICTRGAHSLTAHTFTMLRPAHRACYALLTTHATPVATARMRVCVYMAIRVSYTLRLLHAPRACMYMHAFGPKSRLTTAYACTRLHIYASINIRTSGRP